MIDRLIDWLIVEVRGRGQMSEVGANIRQSLPPTDS